MLLVLLIILLELPRLLCSKLLIVLLDLSPLCLKLALLICKSDSVVPLLIDQMLALGLFEIRFLLQIFYMLFTSQVSVLFFLQFSSQSDALFFLYGLFRFLPDILPDLYSLPFLLLVSVPVLLRLYLKHFSVL